MSESNRITSSMATTGFWLAQTMFGDLKNIHEMIALTVSPSFLSILGVTTNELSRIALRKGAPQIFDWQTRLMILTKQLTDSGSELSASNLACFDGFVFTFDGWRL